MTKPALISAICSAVALPETTDAAIPEWVHILPAGDELLTTDQRGPYKVEDHQAIIANSYARLPRIIIDENHATDTAAKQGHSAPARGYITEMEVRKDGIWGKVDWTEGGKALISDRSYWGVSPVLMVSKTTKAVHSIARVSLTNEPNLRGLAALNSESSMSFSAKLAKALGLEEDASEDDILAAVGKLTKQGDDEEAEANAALASVAKALSLKEDASADDIVAAAQAATAGDDKLVTALQTRLSEAEKELKELNTSRKRDAAEAFVDGEIKAGRVGLTPVRDEYISMHMADPARAEKLVGAMPKMDGELLVDTPPAADGELQLNSVQTDVARIMGLDPEAYKKTLAAENAA